MPSDALRTRPRARRTRPYCASTPALREPSGAEGALGPAVAQPTPTQNPELLRAWRQYILSAGEADCTQHPAYLLAQSTHTHSLHTLAIRCRSTPRRTAPTHRTRRRASPRRASPAAIRSTPWRATQAPCATSPSPSGARVETRSSRSSAPAKTCAPPSTAVPRTLTRPAGRSPSLQERLPAALPALIRLFLVRVAHIRGGQPARAPRERGKEPRAARRGPARRGGEAQAAPPARAPAVPPPPREPRAEAGCCVRRRAALTAVSLGPGACSNEQG